MKKVYIKHLLANMVILLIVLSFMLSVLWNTSRGLQGMSDADLYIQQGPGLASIYAGGFCTITFVLSGCLCWWVIRSSCRDVKSRQNIIESQKLQLYESIEQLQFAVHMAETANEAKRNFLGQMSHDIRTPMNAIVGYSELIAQQAGNIEKVQDYACKITLASKSLLGLINDVLDMSRIESGNLKLSSSEFNILDVAEELVAAIRPQSEEKHQKFFYEVKGVDKQKTLWGDRARICQIVLNLLSNAVKYTPAGGEIDFLVQLQEMGGSTYLQFDIRDTGCGMDDSFLPLIFEPFEREENPEIRNVQGTGLGMAIAKCYIDLMNGSIAIESKKGKGTSICVRIPLEVIAAENPSESVPDLSSDNSLTGLRFLVAEDNELNGEIISDILSLRGAHCDIAENGQVVVKRFLESDENLYDYILMDIQMPVMNGYEATKEIRSSQHSRAKTIPIIAMTADAFESDVRKAFAAGMNAHLAKPIDMEAFVNVVSAVKG